LYFDAKNELSYQGRTPQNEDTGEETMKALMAVVMGVILVVAMAVASNNYAVAAPGGHGHGGHHGKHHGHHGGHWGYGPGYIVGASSVVIGDECPTVKRCYINQFGEKRCRWVQDCD
jgi:hypothetical protein